MSLSLIRDFGRSKIRFTLVSLSKPVAQLLKMGGLTTDQKWCYRISDMTIWRDSLGDIMAWDIYIHITYYASRQVTNAILGSQPAILRRYHRKNHGDTMMIFYGIEKAAGI